MENCDQKLTPGLMLLTFMAIHLTSSYSREYGFSTQCLRVLYYSRGQHGRCCLFFCCCVSEEVSSLLSVPNDDPGILSWLGVVGLKKNWDQKLSSGLLLTIMSTVCGGKLQSDVVETLLGLDETHRSRIVVIILGRTKQKYLAKSLCFTLLSWCWRHAACNHLVQILRAQDTRSQVSSRPVGPHFLQRGPIPEFSGFCGMKKFKNSPLG